MKQLSGLLLCLAAVPATATDYYAQLWSTVPPGPSSGSNSDLLTDIGYRVGDWPTLIDVTNVESIAELIAVIEDDLNLPHTLYLGAGTYDNANDVVVINSRVTESLTLIGVGAQTILDAQGHDRIDTVFSNGRSGLTVRDLKIVGGARAFNFVGGDFSVSSRNVVGNTIENVHMSNQSEFGVRVDCSHESHSEFNLSNSSIIDDDKNAIGIRLIVRGDCDLHNIRIRDNYFSGLEKGIQFYSLEADAGLNNSSAFDVIISGNSIVDTRNYGIVIQSGLRSDMGIISYIHDNYLQDIGDPDEPNVNGIQLSWCRDLIVERNIINGVHTSAPDGHGIIADWAWKDNDYLSDGVIIRNNTVYGAKSTGCDAGLSAGITVYKAINTKIHHNVSFDNCIGYKMTRLNSTGNSFYNNTAFANVLASARADQIAAPSVWANNLFDGAGITPFGLVVANEGTSIPEMSSSLFFGHTVASKHDLRSGQDIPLGPGSMEAAPLLVNIYELSAGSPAIDSADGSILAMLPDAQSINGIIIKDAQGALFPNGGGTLDIGAFEYAIDTDADGFYDGEDNCAQTANPSQLDQDADSVGDACDNCLEISNPEQCNTNGGAGSGQDEFGNACDGDLDNNGIVNSFDLEILRAAVGQSGVQDADL
ncbi:MAG: hypothetical protein HKN49_14825, partial [Gammaproteobacteria bacterium]|nr:hypothetical protein [Gammaproteobacteria bacterium]